MAESDRKTWFMISRVDDLDPAHSLTYRGAVVLYPSEEMAEDEKTKLVPPERQHEYQIVPAKLFVGLEDDWRIVPAEMLATMEKGCQKA